MIIPVIKDYHDDGVNIYDKSSFNLKEGVTILVGCNGAGKSTLIHQIKNFCEKNDIKCLYYDNQHDGGSISMEHAMMHNNYSLLATLVCSSEGEQIHLNVGEMFAKIGGQIRHTEAGKDIVILLDAIDSGLDITNMEEIRDGFNEFIIPDAVNMKINLYVVISTNSYELCIGNNCLDVNSLKYINIKSYNKFADIVRKSRMRKTARYDEIESLKNNRRIKIKRERPGIDLHNAEGEIVTEEIQKLKGSMMTKDQVEDFDHSGIIKSHITSLEYPSKLSSTISPSHINSFMSTSTVLPN